MSDAVTDQACYRYQYVVNDTLGNPTTYTSDDVKVDLGAPSAPGLSFSSLTNAFFGGQRLDGLTTARRPPPGRSG